MSSSHPFAFFTCLLFVATITAGCLGAEEPNSHFVASATATVGGEGYYMLSWDYAAADLHPMGGTITIDVDEATNTGSIRADGVAHMDTFEFALTTFNHSSSDFHSGGIAANFLEHGDSGVGNALLPAMNLLLATWGPANLTLNGAIAIDPYTGNDTWAAHVMVTNTGVRKDGHGGAFKADGVSPYDPATPGDASIGSDNEVHVVFTSLAPAADLAPLNFSWQASANGVTGPVSTVIPMEATGGDFLININLGGQPHEATGVTFDLIDPSGQVRESVTAGRTSPQRTLEKTANSGTIGNWVLRATGEAIPTDFTVDIQVTYPSYPMHYFVWENVDIEQRVVA